MNGKKPGIKEVAKLAGVSIATVSYVVNQNKPVADATRAKVEAAMRELQYQPNLMARGLKTQKTGIVGIVIPDLVSPYFARMVSEMGDVLYQSGIQVLVCMSQGLVEREEKFFARMTHQIDGLIVAPAEPATSRRLADWDQDNCPLVFVDRKPAPVSLAPYIISANEQAGSDVFHHLHRKYDQLAVISMQPGTSAVGERIAGFMSMAIRHGESPLTFFAGEEAGRTAGRRQAERLLRQREGTLGIFCTTNDVTMGCVSWLKAEGVALGTDVGVVGYDDADWMLFTQPTISAVRADPALIGRRAATTLMSLLSGSPIDHTLEIAAQLLARESSLPMGAPTGGGRRD